MKKTILTFILIANFSNIFALGDSITNGRIMINDFSINIGPEIPRVTVLLDDKNATKIYEELGNTKLTSEYMEDGLNVREILSKGIQCFKGKKVSCILIMGF